MAEPTDAEVIRAALEHRLDGVHVATVCQVVSYDPILQTADLRPVVRRAIRNEDDEIVEHEELCVLPNVPVLWPRAGGFFFHMPLAAGDHVLAVFAHESFAMWRETGSVSDPGDLRKHGLSNAIAIAGIEHALAPLSPAPLDLAARIAGMCFGEDGTPRQVQFDALGMKLGALAVSPVALAAPLLVCLAAMGAANTAAAASESAIATALADIQAALAAIVAIPANAAAAGAVTTSGTSVSAATTAAGASATAATAGAAAATTAAGTVPATLVRAQ